MKQWCTVPAWSAALLCAVASWHARHRHEHGHENENEHGYAHAHAHPWTRQREKADSDAAANLSGGLMHMHLLQWSAALPTRLAIKAGSQSCG